MGQARERWEVAAAAGLGIGGDARSWFDSDVVNTFRFADHVNPFDRTLAIWALGYAVDLYTPEGITLVAPPATDTE